LFLHCVLDKPRDEYWAAHRGRGGKVQGGSSFCNEGESSTIHYSTKVRVSDKVAGILMLGC